MAYSARLREMSSQTLEGRLAAYATLYVPALLAWLFSFDPLMSFGIAWMGSWGILWMSMTGRVRPLPGDRSWEQQLFRPLFLSQIMFFGLFCLGPVFYMWDLVAAGGILQEIGGEIQRTAAAQRYYVLGHAAFVHGILALMDYRRSGEWSVEVPVSMTRLFLWATAGAFTCYFLFANISGLGQFAGKFQYLFVVAAILAIAYATRNGTTLDVLVAGGLYGFILMEVILSGWKHQIILVIGLLLLALFPAYKRTVGIAGVVVVIAFATLLPAYNNVFRQLSWQENMSPQRAAQVAFDRATSGQMDLGRVSWRFLTNRLTTVSLFTDYMESVPRQRPFYGLMTTEQAVFAVIPRVFWPSKPNTERVVMERVFSNTSIRSDSRVSAKPLIVVDGYLAGGWIGVLLSCLALGGIASVASRWAERWFGGYEIGSQLVFTGLFARVLFVASFEFLFNALLWSFVLMSVLAFGLWLTGFLMWQPGARSSLRDPAPASNSPSMRV
jgi:hypothetical protein